MVCVLCTEQILVALSEEMAEGFVDNSFCFVAWTNDIIYMQDYIRKPGC